MIKKNPGIVRITAQQLNVPEEIALEIEAEIMQPKEQRTAIRLGEDRTDRKRMLPTQVADQRRAKRLARDAEIEARHLAEDRAFLEANAAAQPTPQRSQPAIEKARPISQRQARLNQRIDEQIAVALGQ